MSQQPVRRIGISSRRLLELAATAALLIAVTVVVCGTVWWRARQAELNRRLVEIINPPWSSPELPEQEIRNLLRQGANVSSRTRFGTPLLVLAADYSRDTFVSELLNRGAVIDAKDANGRTALMAAAENGDRVLVKTLLDRGANVHAKDHWNRGVLQVLRDSWYMDVDDRMAVDGLLVRAGAKR
jgi:ankyrin repeat protein